MAGSRTVLNFQKVGESAVSQRGLALLIIAPVSVLPCVNWADLALGLPHAVPYSHKLTY